MQLVSHMLQHSRVASSSFNRCDSLLALLDWMRSPLIHWIGLARLSKAHLLRRPCTDRKPAFLSSNPATFHAGTYQSSRLKPLL